MTDRVFNFSPGPAVLPLEVLERARDEMLSLPGVGMSVLEISHRSPAFDRILEETLASVKGLLGIGDSHEVVFLQGGASLQFSMVPMNLLRGQPSAADYVITGTWGATGAKEARREGKVHVAVDFTRYREDGSAIGHYFSLYVVTRQDGHWGIQVGSGNGT